jgi:CRP-like cAMP-binding protein
MPANHLLAQLASSADLEWWGQLESIPLALRQVLYDIDCPIEHVYFVEEGMVSIVSAEFGGAAVETGTVGHEGLVGLPVFLGSGSTSSQAFCQIAGRARRMTAGAFMAAVGSDARLRSVLGRYAQAFLTQAQQGSACNRLHTIRQRCARWLLETHDRVGEDTLRLTHQFLAQMLGVRRATVSEIAAQLQWERLISYGYGKINILNRPGLESAACECYAIVRREYDRLVQGRAAPSLFTGRDTAVSGETTLREPEENEDQVPRARS